MLVNVCYIQYQTLNAQGIIDCRTLEGQGEIIAAVLHNPVSTRSERIALFERAAESIACASGKAVYVTADLDIYCELGKKDCDFFAIKKELIRRGTMFYSGDSGRE